MALRTRNRLALLSTVFASSLLAVACGGSSFGSSDSSGGASGAGATASDSSALDAANAGMNVGASEAPAFGDAQIEALDSMDTTVALAAEPIDLTIDEAAKPGASAYRIALVWGHLPAAHDATATDDDAVPETWTGGVSVPAGAIGLKRTIAFDARDHITPRTDPKTVSFVSHTLPYVDGLLLRVIVPAGATPTLHFATDALTTDIDLSALATKVGGVQRLASDASEGLAWIGFPEDAGCARGFVHGRWVKSHAAFGALRGVVSDADGERVGHLRGLWGHAPKRDANVWFAKYIDKAGGAKGLAFGKYGDGAFAGLWGAKDETDIDVGHVEGIYSDGFDKDDGRGVWLGRWSEKCGK